MAVSRVSNATAATAVAGLHMVTPTSVVVGSGTGSVAGQGGVTFNGVSSITLNGCFTSNYEHYRVMFSALPSAMLGIGVQVSSAGTANSSSYKWQQGGSFNGSPNASGSVSATSAELGFISNNGQCGLEFSILNPFTTTHTTMYGDFIYTAGTDFIFRKTCAKHEVASSFDGIRIFVSSGSFTGTVRVYGYNNGGA